MNVIVKIPENNAHISNIAFIRAFCIKKTIEDMNIDTKDKEKIFKDILEYLKNN